jgi:hypothetical protein
MNGSSSLSAIPTGRLDIRLPDRLLAIYSLLLILVGTPCNLLCCLIYFQKANRSNSIKIIFGYLAFLDTVVLYTFNLNYVVREFNVQEKIVFTHQQQPRIDHAYSNESRTHVIFEKKNLEEYSLFLCRWLSYIGKTNVRHARMTTQKFNLFFVAFTRGKHPDVADRTLSF